MLPSHKVKAHFGLDYESRVRGRNEVILYGNFSDPKGGKVRRECIAQCSKRMLIKPARLFTVPFRGSDRGPKGYTSRGDDDCRTCSSGKYLGLRPISTAVSVARELSKTLA